MRSSCAPPGKRKAGAIAMGRRSKPKSKWVAVDLSELGVDHGKQREQRLRDEEQLKKQAEQRLREEELLRQQKEQERIANLEHDLCTAVYKAYDRVSVRDIYDELAEKGLVTKTPAPYALSYNCIAYPRNAERAVDAFWGQLMASMWEEPLNAGKGPLETLAAVLAKCKAQPIGTVDADVERCLCFANGKMKSVFTDPAKRTNPNVQLVCAYGPIHIEAVDATPHVVVKRVALPRAMAVETLSGLTGAIQLAVAELNARRRPAFDLARAESVFYMNIRAVPHVLGARKRAQTQIAKLVAGINDYKSTGEQNVRQGDLHIAILHNNCQCTAALYIKQNLNREQRTHTQACIAECAKNSIDEQLYWSDDVL